MPRFAGSQKSQELKQGRTRRICSRILSGEAMKRSGFGFPKLVSKASADFGWLDTIMEISKSKEQDQKT